VHLVGKTGHALTGTAEELIASGFVSIPQALDPVPDLF